jgi:two-component system repressor protein LuxO
MLNILLVESDERESNALKSTISAAAGDLFVAAAPTGTSGLTMLQEGLQPKLVVSGCQLADMDGFEFYARLRALAPALPVIMLSDRLSVDVYLKAIGMGVAEVLVRPISSRELQAIINAVLFDLPQVRWREIGSDDPGAK